jgi:hypothetical protein
MITSTVDRGGGTGMAFDGALAQRVRQHLGRKPGLVEKKMFGGLAFLLHGNRSVGVHGDGLVRIAPEATEAMKGWLLVDDAGAREPRLTEWVRRRIEYASSFRKK